MIHFNGDRFYGPSLTDGFCCGPGADVSGTAASGVCATPQNARFAALFALHDDFAVAKDVRIHHLRSDHGDDDLAAADDAAPGGFGEGELVRDGDVDFRRAC